MTSFIQKSLRKKSQNIIQYEEVEDTSFDEESKAEPTFYEEDD